MLSSTQILTIRQVLELREQGHFVTVPIGDIATAPTPDLLANALNALDSESAACISYLSLAFERARDGEDAHLCSAVALVCSVLDIGLTTEIKAWISRFNSTRQGGMSYPIAGTWCCLGQLAASSLNPELADTQNTHNTADSLLQELGSLTTQLSANTKIIAAQMLLEYAYGFGKSSLLDLLVSIATHQEVLRLSLPVTQARFYEKLGSLYFNRSQSAAAKSYWTTAKLIAEEHRLQAAGFMAQIGLIRQLLDESEFAVAGELLETRKPSEGVGRGYQVVFYKHIRARYLLLCNQIDKANIEIDEALELAKRLGLDTPDVAMCLQEKAQALFARGAIESAEQVLSCFAADSVGDSVAGIKVNALLMRFVRLHENQLQAAEAALAEGLDLASQIGFIRFLRSLPHVAAKVCKFALELDVQTSFVRQVIVERRLSAPEGSGPQWPWLLKISVLGPLLVELAGKPLQFPGRTQAKPLELLCFLACSNRMSAESAAICSALWFTDDLSKSARNLEVTVSRLRKLLAADNIVRVSNGQISLDPGLFWSDWAYFRTLSHNLLSLCAKPKPIAGPAVETIVGQLLGIHRGTFLSGSDDVPWVIGKRDDAKQLFVATALAAASALDRQGKTQMTTAFLESAIQHEPLSEGLAAGLMRHYAKHRQVADALRVYRFFRDQVSLRLGIKPSAEIEALKASLTG